MDASFRLKQIAQRALRALDLAREHGLPAHEHQDEQVRVGQNLDRAAEPTQLAVGGRQKGKQRLAHHERRIRRQRLRQERTITPSLHGIGAGAVLMGKCGCGVGIHAAYCTERKQRR